MANFNTHICIAGAVSGIAASVLFSVSSVSVSEMLLLWLLGSVGGILPDIDSDNSTATKLIFGLLTVAACIASLILLADSLSLIELWVALMVIILAIRFIFMPIVASQTRHRGIFHSILAGCFFCFAVATLASFYFQPMFAWTLGFFCLLGFLIHLLLDECYSVDLLNTKIKRSFGTALKPFSFKYKKSSVAMGVLTIYVFSMTPSVKPFYQHYFSNDFAMAVAEAFWPEQTIYGLFNNPMNATVQASGL